MTTKFTITTSILLLPLVLVLTTPGLASAASVAEFENDFKVGYEPRALDYYTNFDADAETNQDEDNGLSSGRIAVGEKDHNRIDTSGKSSSGDSKLIVVAAPATTTTTGLVSFLGACKEDTKQLCQEENSYAATACMKDKFEQLSPLCQEYFKAKSQCYSELQEMKYCSPAKLTCLATHADDRKLSVFCRKSKFAHYVKAAIPGYTKKDKVV